MNPRPNTSLSGLSRRTVLGVTVAGATGLLVACGGSSTAADPSDDTPDATSPSADESSSSSGGGDGASSGLVKTSKVPVGEGVILKDQRIVVTQPTAGNFKAFSAVCTHQACLVDEIKNGTITCPCHGSQYSIKDGSVTHGPAPKSLKEIAVKVDGAEVVKA